MKVQYFSSLGATLALALGAPAMAQSGDDMSSADWSGPYVGGSLGYNWQPNFQRDTNERVVFDTNGDGVYGDPVTTTSGGDAFSPGFCRGRALGSTPGTCSGDKDGRVGFSGYVGYDKQFGNIVVGGVLEGGRTMIGNSVSAFSTTPASYVLSRRIDWDGSARLRAGYALPTGTLVYGTGGLAYAKIKNSFATSNNYNSFTESNTSNDEWGWTAGGGVDQRITDHFSIGVLYRYTRFEPEGYTVTAGQGAPPSTTNPFVITPSGSTNMQRTNNVMDSHSVRATASFHF